MMANLWSKAAAAAFAFCGCFVIADATLGNSPGYSLWYGPLAVCAYVTGAIGVIGMVCGIFIALSSARSRTVLGDDKLLHIYEIVNKTDLTWAQKMLLLKDYNGMWIQVSGSVVDVGNSSDSPAHAIVGSSVCDLRVFMKFSSKDLFYRRPSIIASGASVRVIGKIEQIKPNGISLVKCETCELPG